MDLKHLEQVGIDGIQEQIERFERDLCVDESDLNRGTWEIKGRIDLTNFRKGGLNWATKTDIKKFLEEINSKSEVGIRFTKGSGNIQLDVQNETTGRRLSSSKACIIFSPDDKDFGIMINRYESHQKLEAVHRLIQVISETFSITPGSLRRSWRVSLL